MVANSHLVERDETLSPENVKETNVHQPQETNRLAIPSPGGSPLTGWINDITEAWARGAANTLSLGRLLGEARASLRYGDWSQLWRSRRLPFSKRKGEMLVTIGQALGRLDAQNSAQLPLAWNAVYYLARLGRPTVERLIAEGQIHPGLTLRQARALLAKQRPGMIRSTRRSSIKQRLDGLAAFVGETMATWNDEERSLAYIALLRLAEQVEPDFAAHTVTTNQVGFQPAVSDSLSNRIHPFAPFDFTQNIHRPRHENNHLLYPVNYRTESFDSGATKRLRGKFRPAGGWLVELRCF